MKFGPKHTMWLAYWQNAWNDIRTIKNCWIARLPNTVCVRSQCYTKDSVFWLAQMMLCVMTLCNLVPFVEPNFIWDCRYVYWLLLHVTMFVMVYYVISVKFFYRKYIILIKIINKYYMYDGLNHFMICLYIRVHVLE